MAFRCEPPAVYQGKFDPRVLFKAFGALHDIRA
jgi:oleate hydratase